MSLLSDKLQNHRIQSKTKKSKVISLSLVKKIKNINFEKGESETEFVIDSILLPIQRKYKERSKNLQEEYNGFDIK